MKVPPEVTVSQFAKSQIKAQLEKIFQNRQSAMKSCKLRDTFVAYFCHSVGGFLLFKLQNQSSSVLCPGKYLPKNSGTRGAKGTFVLLRAGIDKGAQLDWRGHRCKKSGALAGAKKGGYPIELLLLFGFDCN